MIILIIILGHTFIMINYYFLQLVQLFKQLEQLNNILNKNESTKAVRDLQKGADPGRGFIWHGLPGGVPAREDPGRHQADRYPADVRGGTAGDPARGENSRSAVASSYCKIPGSLQNQEREIVHCDGLRRRRRPAGENKR